MENQQKVLELPDALIETLVEEARSWAGHAGLLMTKNGNWDAAPFTLVPTRFPRELFERVVVLAPLFNKLVHEVVKDDSFLHESLDKMTEDSFTIKLLEIMDKVKQEKGHKQTIELGIHRSDYMIDAGQMGLTIKQVELNTIAASFSNLSALVGKLHRFLIERMDELNHLYHVDNLPVNPTHELIPAAIAKAWELYNNKSGVVMMIIHPNDTNVFDQKWMEYNLWNRHHIPLIRRSLADIAQRGKVDPQSNELYIDGKLVSVAYFRAGYTPDDYPTNTEWEGRILLERSLAIKCPSIKYHLAGAKKIQQVLAKEGVLERFMKDQKEANQLRECFAGLYSLGFDEPNADEIIKKAKENPDNYVMKPQREGGGNNIYGKDIKESLTTFSPLKRSGFILMDRLNPPTNPTIIVRDKNYSKVDSLSELGIFSVYLSDGDKEILNSSAGYLLRTKVSTVFEGGVAAGASALDSVYLV